MKPMGPGPQQLRAGVVMVTAEESRRVRALSARLGVGKARAALGLGFDTFDAARDEGRMNIATRDRFLEALARAEAAAR